MFCKVFEVSAKSSYNSFLNLFCHIQVSVIQKCFICLFLAFNTVWKRRTQPWGSRFVSTWSQSRLSTLDLDSRSRLFSKVDLHMMDNLDGFQKLVSTIKVSRSRLRYLDLVLMSSAKTVLFGRDLDFLRLVETFVIFLDFSIFFSISIQK